MIVLILGANGSGKSAYAEKLACKLSKLRYYIATMKPYGKEGAARIEKHMHQRQGMGFLTLELPYTVGDARLSFDAVVLLEDVSNLLGNVMFELCGGAKEVFSDIALLSKKAAHTVIVSIGDFNDGDYDEGTKGYIRAMRQLNESLSTFSDVVVKMHDGEPICMKGDVHALY